MAEAKANGIRPSGIAVRWRPTGSKPSENGRAYPTANGRPPSTAPDTTQRSWRRAVTDGTRCNAKIMIDSPPITHAAR